MCSTEIEHFLKNVFFFIQSGENVVFWSIVVDFSIACFSVAVNSRETSVGCPTVSELHPSVLFTKSET